MYSMSVYSIVYFLELVFTMLIFVFKIQLVYSKWVLYLVPKISVKKTSIVHQLMRAGDVFRDLGERA